ncbi:MAG: queuosine precursor transporter [Clostridia bacterium]|nr:queuosine precursor transporter [Clostridia bacterium]
MPNEALLLISVFVIYISVIMFFRLFGRTGLYCWMVMATVAANIEVTMVVDAFGMEQTLGNVLFASTFLATDILSETAGRKAANKAVYISIATSVIFIVISQSWMLYTPNQSDIAHESITRVFANTPRIMLASIVVYAIVQLFDVFAYHFIWERTTRICNDSSRFLWLRNNLATMLSQLINTVLYTYAAFWGIYSGKTILNIVVSTFVIYLFTSLLDTPAVYIARRIAKKHPSEGESNV